MLGSILLSVLFVVLAVAFVVVHRRNRRAGRSWQHLLRDLSPVSSQWLSDYRRSG